MKKIFVFATVLFILGSCLTASAASEPYEGYMYDIRREVLASPNAYEPDGEIYGLSLNAPSDFYFDTRSETLAVLDKGNNRVILTDSEFNIIKTIDTFTLNGLPTPLNGAEGVYLDGSLIIADTQNSRIIVCDFDGNIVKEILKPESNSYDADKFMPRKILKDSSGNLYALCDGVYKGAVVFDDDYNFTGYFGSNRVEVTLSVLIDSFWKSIMTEEQRGQTARNVPVEYTNFDVDSEGFVYTCTRSVMTNQWNTIKKLNFAGEDIYRSDVPPMNGKFGELRVDYRENSMFDTQFVDIKSDGKYIYGLDAQRGKVYRYDREGNLITVFGGLDDIRGLTLAPVAVECAGGRVLVLDRDKNCISVYKNTEYGMLLNDAFESYGAGRFEESAEYWREVLVRNNNYYIAYRGLANAAYNQGDFKAAMRYYELGYDQTGYSRAYKDYRSVVLSRYFPVIAVLLLILVALPFALPLLRRKKRLSALEGYVPEERPKWVYPLRQLIKPLSTVEDLRFRKKESYKAALIIVFLWFFATVLSEQFTGFTFSMKRVGDVNVIFVFLKTAALFLMFTVSNWSICTLVDGDGKFKQIFTACAYALLPAALSLFVTTALSNVLVAEEGMFLSWINGAAVLYGVLLLLFGLKEIHQFSFFKAVVSTVFTVIGLLLILFLLLLLSSLIQQLYVFLTSVYNELSIRSLNG